MAGQNHLSGTIRAGEIVKPWLILGPFYEDFSARVQGLTFFERPGASVGESAMLEVVEDARSVLAASPREGAEASFRGQPRRWSLVRSPEEYLSWGTYNISNHLGAAFLSTRLTPEKPGRQEMRLYARISSRAIMYINGVEVFDSQRSPVKSVDGVYTYVFQTDLKAGENLVTVALFRLARMAQVGLRLEVTGSDVQACVYPPETITPAVREAVEQEVASLRLAGDVFYPGQPLGYRLESAPASGDPNSGIRLQVQLADDTGQVIHEALPAQAGFVELCQAGDLPDGHYSLVSTWYGPDEVPLTQVVFGVHKVTPVAAPAGFDRLEERKQMVLEHYAGNREREVHGIWTQVARYALGRYDEINIDAIRSTCEFINARKDCSDFVIQGILRLMYWERENRRLSTEVNAMMKDTMLNFKYWVDEPGDTVMYMGSENHRLLFHVAEWMAGHLFPTEMFPNSGQNGLYHTAKSYVYITEWLRQRGRFGFDEWHSNSYYPICIAPLINLYDFSTHEGYYKLRQMVGGILDQMLFYMAADSYQGIFGTTHGRSYGIYVKYPDFEGTSALNWLYFTTGSLTKGTSGMAPVCSATSTYAPPEILFAMANDQSSVVEARRRQGISRHPHARHADFVVYRTPDYMLSGIQDHRKGEYESSTHVAQVTLGKKNVIFWSCPHTVGEGSGLRPDYWSGSTTLPRVIQAANVMSLSWRLTKFAWMSHCLFEQERFDEVRFEKDWAFARVGDGYVAIYATGGLQVAGSGQYAGRELQCFAREHTWLVECGRKADYGSFDAFVEKVSTAEIKEANGVITYQSPGVGEFVTGWNVRPSVNGAAIQTKGYPMIDSSWGHADFGSGELRLQYGDMEYELWFNQ